MATYRVPFTTATPTALAHYQTKPRIGHISPLLLPYGEGPRERCSMRSMFDKNALRGGRRSGRIVKKDGVREREWGRGMKCTALYYYTRDRPTMFNLEGTVSTGGIDGYGRYGSTWL